MQTETVQLSQVRVNKANPRTITEKKLRLLVERLLAFPKMIEVRPVVVDNTMTALGGNMRVRALNLIAQMSIEEIKGTLTKTKDYQTLSKGEQEALIDRWQVWLDKPTVPVAKASQFSDAEKKQFIIADNASFGEWDYDALANEWDAADLTDWGLDVWDKPFGEGLAGTDVQDNPAAEKGWDAGVPENGSLQDRFVVPPFSILDTRKGYWQARKKLWRNKIGDTGETRNDTLLRSPEVKYKDLYLRTRKHREQLGISFAEYLDKYVPADVLAAENNKVLAAGVSLFDPVVSEIMAKWFTPSEGSRIFDCFAGDTNKGLVFGMCGHTFRGIELRREQVDVNNRVLEGRGLDVEYICDDGRNVSRHFDAESQDLLFSCPPYYDLEVYSDNPNDASNQGSYEEFIGILKKAFKDALTCLKSNRFAVIVVGDVRDKKSGFYYDFCGDIKRIFKEAGASLYNELILVETGASSALRASRYMESRKVAKMHQNVLVFYKGDPKDIKKYFKKIEYTSEDYAAFERIAECEPNATDRNSSE